RAMDGSARGEGVAPAGGAPDAADGRRGGGGQGQGERAVQRERPGAQDVCRPVWIGELHFSGAPVVAPWSSGSTVGARRAAMATSIRATKAKPPKMAAG